MVGFEVSLRYTESIDGSECWVTPSSRLENKEIEDRVKFPVFSRLGIEAIFPQVPSLTLHLTPRNSNELFDNTAVSAFKIMILLKTYHVSLREWGINHAAIWNFSLPRTAGWPSHTQIVIWLE